MKIGTLDTDRSVVIVAEIGNNHEGSFRVAEELVHKAADCGADAVKFQTFRAELFVGPSDAARLRRLKNFELSQAQFAELAKVARGRGLHFLSTPLDLESAAFLDSIVDAYKVASGDNNFVPLLRQVARTGRPVVLSTGLSDLDQVRASVQILQDAWVERGHAGQLALLHCVSSYPVPPEQANLRSIPALAAAFPGAAVGYSDHTVGIEAAVLAVAVGARILEKHFTLDHHHSDFRDHQLSADPAELRALVERVRTASRMLGSEGKAVQPCEAPGVLAHRRSIAAARALPKGHRLRAADLVWLRPGGGFPPGAEARVVGRVLNQALDAGTLLREEMMA